ncbi:MAG: MBL fold metallo-hydrolase [Patescibacteria group bacterium]
MSTKPSITFFTGVSTVTGANFLLDTGSSRILIDCGMVQGERFATEENAKPFGYDVSSIDALIITHAHLDHVGRIPKLVKEGYQGPIYSTPVTRELAELVLSDAVGILAMDAKQNGTLPMYDTEDVQATFPLWKTIPYHEQTDITDDVSVFLKDAGHILGSAMIEASIKSPGKNPLKVLFTGDVGNSPAPLLCDTETVGDVDYMVMESVYGDRNHESRAQRLDQFTKVINDTLNRGGTLVIPAFSIDRTQLLLYELNNLVEKKLIPSVPVFVDSPMAIKATQVYQANTELFNDGVKKQISGGDNIFDFPHLQFTVSQNESRDIERLSGAKIILAGSGMSVGGRVVSHEAGYLPDARNTILLVGYQTAGSLGRKIADGSKEVTIHGQKVQVKAHVETLYGYSAHKDSDHLVDFVATASDRLKKAFVVMGEPKAAMHLAQRLNDELDMEAVVPERLKEYEVK